MSHLNLLNISKEIQNIKNVLEQLNYNYSNLNTKYNNINTKIHDLNEFNNLDFETSSDEIKLEIDGLKNKIEEINHLNYTQSKNYIDIENPIYNYLKSINLKEIYIYKYIFLNCSIIEDLILIEKDTCKNIGIPDYIYDSVKKEAQNYIYNIHKKIL